MKNYQKMQFTADVEHVKAAMETLDMNGVQLSVALHLGSHVVGEWLAGKQRCPAWSKLAINELLRQHGADDGAGIRMVVARVPRGRELNAVKSLLDALGVDYITDLS